MKNIILLFFSLFICSYTFSQIEVSEVTISYEGDGIYKFSANYVGFTTNKIDNAIDKSVAEFERKNKVKGKLISRDKTLVETKNYMPTYRADFLIIFHTINDNILFVSDEELAIINAEIIKQLKQYKKLKEDGVFDEAKYLELIEKLIDSLVVL